MTHHNASPWFIYILRCSDNSLYTGITKDVERRLDEHFKQGPRCAKYLRNRGPFTLVYKEIVTTHTLALQREIEIKKLTKDKKESLIEELGIL